MAGVMIFIGITQILNQMYVECDGIKHYRVLWHQFYENAGGIDYLYLGSSHVYRDIDPGILDQMTGKRNFDLASPAQSLDGSFFC